jgi:glutamate racemase
MNKKDSPIGFFDAGMGGISVLGRAIQKMPNEKYIYLGDSINQPYAAWSKEELIDICIKDCKFMCDKGAKAIVVACNTATMVAIEAMRENFDIPILGMWPAVKPASEICEDGKIIVMATETTLASERLSELLEMHAKGKRVYKTVCRDIITLVESGTIEGQEMENLIRENYKDFDLEETTAIVLGCTHFGFSANLLKKVLGENVRIADGGVGVVNHLYTILKDSDLLCETKKQDYDYEIYNTKGAEYVENSERLLTRFLNVLENEDMESM